MSEFIECEVLLITEKPTKNGGTVYNLKVDIDGDEEWLGYGFDKPNFTKGAIIECDIEENGDYLNCLADTVEVIEEGEKPKPKRGRSGGSSRGSSRGGSRDKPKSRGRTSRKEGAEEKPARRAKAKTTAPVDWDRKDKTIRLQSCQNTAIALVKVALEQGAIKLPSKQALKYDALIALCDEEAVRLYQKYEDTLDGKKASKPSAEEDDDDEYDDDDIPD